MGNNLRPPPDRRSRTAQFGRTGVPNLSSWEISSIRSAIDAHERGSFSSSAILADYLERNPRIMSALGTRVQGALGLPFSFESSTEKRRAKVAARELGLPWSKIAPESLLSDLLRWAVLMGVSFAELWWETSPQGWVPRLRVVHPYWVSWRDFEGRFVCQTERGIVPITPGDGWVVFSSSSDRPWMRGVVRCLALESEIRTLAVRDWARWSEVHGLPIKKALVPANVSKDEKDDFFDGVSEMGVEGTILLPRGVTEEESFDLQLLEATGREFEGFQRLLSEVAGDVSIAILGQNLTTEVSGGSFAAAQVHDRVRQDYLEADTETLSTCLREQVLCSWARFNKGDEELAPFPYWDAATPEDREKLASTAATLGASIPQWNAALAPQGMSIDTKALAEKVGLPLTALALPEPQPPANPQTDPQPAQD